MTVPDFDTPTAPPEPIAFRLLGREWACHPEPTENALVASQVGGAMAAYADDFPEATTAIIADLALRFVSWSVIDADEWLAAIAGARMPAETVIDVMSWLSTQYNPPAEPAPVVPSAAPPRPPKPAASRRTSIEELERIAAKPKVGGLIERV